MHYTSMIHDMVLSTEYSRYMHSFTTHDMALSTEDSRYAYIHHAMTWCCLLKITDMHTSTVHDMVLSTEDSRYVYIHNT